MIIIALLLLAAIIASSTLIFRFILSIVYKENKKYNTIISVVLSFLFITVLRININIVEGLENYYGYNNYIGSDRLMLQSIMLYFIEVMVLMFVIVKIGRAK